MVEEQVYFFEKDSLVPLSTSSFLESPEGFTEGSSLSRDPQGGTVSALWGLQGAGRNHCIPPVYHVKIEEPSRKKQVQ